MALALLIDRALGWPDALYRRIGHPVTWIGAAIAAADRAWNPGGPGRTARLRGLGTTFGIIFLSAGTALGIAALMPTGLAGVCLTALLTWPLVAARSLDTHVAAVAPPLDAGDLDNARTAVAHIVGRDPTRLDEAGVARAAIESLAENTSDGVTAPLFWGALLGLPGIAAYKAINTLDSMIGYRTPRHVGFGWAAARIDDLVNLVPARLTGLGFALMSARPSAALRTMARDARLHRSPNAGWPEAAMAGGLGIRVSGPRIYDGTKTTDPYVNAGRPDPGAADITRALGLYRRFLGLTFLSLLAVAALGIL
ncbi:MAG: adenosylcobinamide-phosphate synthase CbiB [Pseudomonadota bacterium]